MVRLSSYLLTRVIRTDASGGDLQWKMPDSCACKPSAV
jgi:hypothetical protein